MTDRLAVIDQLRAAGVECYTRAEWDSPQERTGAYARRGRTHPMPAGPAAYHYLHITVTGDTDTVQQGKAGARQIEGYGYSTPPMVSYQDLVTNEGRYFQGQDYGTKGTHTVNDKKVPGFPRDLNRSGYACAILQNVGDEVTDVQLRVIAMILAARELAGLVKRGAPIFPHRKFAPKSCPGDRAVARLDEIEHLKDKFVREGLPNTQEDPMSQYAPDLKRIEEKVDALTKAQTATNAKVDKLADLEQRRYAANRKGDNIRHAAAMTRLQALAAQGGATQAQLTEVLAELASDEG